MRGEHRNAQQRRRTHINSYVTNYSGMIRQSDILRLIITPYIIATAIAKRRTCRSSRFRGLDNERALDVDLNRAGMADSATNLGGRSHSPGSSRDRRYYFPRCRRIVAVVIGVVAATAMDSALRSDFGLGAVLGHRGVGGRHGSGIRDRRGRLNGSYVVRARKLLDRRRSPGMEL